MVPGLAIGAIILAHRAPLPVAQVRPPKLPVSQALCLFLKPQPFRVQSIGCVGSHHVVNLSLILRLHTRKKRAIPEYSQVLRYDRYPPSCKTPSSALTSAPQPPRPSPGTR